MVISFEKIKPQPEGKRSQLYLALWLRDIADKEVGRITGTNDPDNKPHVYVHISKPMLQGKVFTGNEGFEGASSRARMILGHFIPLVERFVSMPHIMDDFSSHAERREWSQKNITDKKLGADLLEFFKKNPLSLNVLVALQTGFRLAAKEMSGLDCEEARYIGEVAANTGKSGGLPDLTLIFKYISDETGKNLYETKAPDEKWEIAHAYEIACRGLLEKIAESSALPRPRYEIGDDLESASFYSTPVTGK